ncbi:MAG: hypothetical protein V3T23_13690, partial [Nitrososphaerales archaeon]
VLIVFLDWINKGRNRDYKVVSRPDESERWQEAIDYVLGDPDPEMAVEVSSIWRSSEAGKEDQYWLRWADQVDKLFTKGSLGPYRVYMDLRVPAGLKPETFAEELRRLVIAEDAILNSPRQKERRLTRDVCHMEVTIVKSSGMGSGLSFARRIDEGADLDGFSNFVDRILAKKSQKLKRYKDEGLETWLIIYNTIWPLKSPDDFQELIMAKMTREHDHIDHIGLVAGNPPDDAWVEVVR